MKYRIEFDSIGKIKVPGDKYWGASTERSRKYFNIGDFLVRPIVIRSIAIIKKAAAIVNAKNKDLDPKLSRYVIKAAEEVIKGKLSFNFPLIISFEALIIALDIFLSKSLFLKFVIAAAFLIIAIDLIKTGLIRKSPISKYFFDRSVDAPQYLSAGTLTLPRVSNSFLNFIIK